MSHTFRQTPRCTDVVVLYNIGYAMVSVAVRFNPGGVALLAQLCHLAMPLGMIPTL